MSSAVWFQAGLVAADEDDVGAGVGDGQGHLAPSPRLPPVMKSRLPSRRKRSRMDMGRSMSDSNDE